MFQKHLGLTEDLKLNFLEHLKSITRKIGKTMYMMRKCQSIIPKSSLLTFYQTFMRSQLDYANIIYDQECNFSFLKKLESLQYSACVAVISAIKDTSQEKIYEELDL